MGLLENERDTDPAPPPLAFSSIRKGELLISVWSDHAGAHSVRALRSELERIVQERRMVSILHVVVEGAPPHPTAEARQLAVEMLRDLGDSVRSVAIVVEGNGFWGATVRGMFLAIATALRPGFRWRIFSTMAPAATWLVPHLALVGRVSPAEIEACVQELKLERG